MSLLLSWQFYLVLCALLVIIEIFSGAMVAGCLAVGTLASAVLAALGFGVNAIILGFCVGDLVAFLCVVPVVKHYRRRPADPEQQAVSGMDALRGRRARVVQAIPEGGIGRVAVDGDNWQARLSDDSAALEGDVLRVVRHESIVLVLDRC